MGAVSQETKSEKGSQFYCDEVTDDLNWTEDCIVFAAEHPVNVSFFPTEALKSMSADSK